jgi:hypothetical protein
MGCAFGMTFLWFYHKLLHFALFLKLLKHILLKKKNDKEVSDGTI